MPASNMYGVARRCNIESGDGGADAQRVGGQYMSTVADRAEQKEAFEHEQTEKRA